MIDTLVYLHIGAGVGAVIGLFGALLSSKGRLWHRRMGKLYALSMALALVLALAVSILTANIFLGLIGLFSSYFVYTGWRLAVTSNGNRNTTDQIATQAMLLCSFLMVGYGAYLVVVGDVLGVTLAVFGAFAFLPAWQDAKRGGQWPTGKDRIVSHLIRMGGASIATLTAVFVVNVETNPAFIAWLLPSAVGTPLIIYWARRTLRSTAITV